VCWCRLQLDFGWPLLPGHVKDSGEEMERFSDESRSAGVPGRHAEDSYFQPHWAGNVFRSTVRQNRPNKAGLECPSVRPCVRTLHAYVRCTSVRPSVKSFFDFNEIWHVGRGGWVMHHGVQYDLIQGQARSRSRALQSCYLLHYLQWELAADRGFLN